MIMSHESGESPLCEKARQMGCTISTLRNLINEYHEPDRSRLAAELERMIQDDKEASI